MNKCRYFILLTVILCSCINIQESSVDQKKFLGSQSNSLDIYDMEPNGTFFNPISLSMQPMDKLIAIAFKGDSDYSQVELQLFDDEKNGQGMVAMLYKKSDNDIDIYHSKGLRFDNLMYSFDRVHEPIETEMDFDFRITDNGLYCQFRMNDKKSNAIQLSVNQSSDKIELVNFLAPVAPQTSNPSFFPFYYIRDGVFCTPSDTQIEIKINGINQKPSRIPMPVNGRIVYLTRYAKLPVIGMWHAEQNDSLVPIEVDNADSSKFEIVSNCGYPELKSIASDNETGNSMRLHFSPSIPDLRCLKSDIKIDGKFTIACDSISGVIGGDYSIIKSDNQVFFTCQPTHGFQPMPGKTWVKTLTWQAHCICNEQHNTMELKSKWIKNKFN